MPYRRDVEFAMDLWKVMLSNLEVKAAESLHRLMNSTAVFGAASLLKDHFGSAEAANSTVITDQLWFLLYECTVSSYMRLRFAVVWFELNVVKLSGCDDPRLGHIVEELNGATLGLMGDAPEWIFTGNAPPENLKIVFTDDRPC